MLLYEVANELPHPVKTPEEYIENASFAQIPTPTGPPSFNKVFNS
jgi:hypothetical protein